ncbi:MAG: aspartate kinase [Myxococcota bacterium]|jgi:aspartate kinase
MLVMKFGGTSVGSAEAIRRSCGIIANTRAETPCAVVVSALSGITDKLIAACDDACERHRPASEIIDQLYAHHEQVCDELGLEAAPLLKPLSELHEVLRGIGYLREFTPRSYDFVLGHGELLSSRIVAAYLTAQGTPAYAITGWDAGILTDDQHGAANVLDATYQRVPERLTDLGSVPIVTGFLAQTETGQRTTLGRGGSDYTAAILGRALNADEIQIWTDVSGILSTDPRIVSAAQPLPDLTFEEAAELAFFGAKVIHPKTIEPAVKAGIPVRVKNTFEPAHPGTRIVGGHRETHRPVVALAVKRDNTILALDSTRMLDAEGYLATVFEALKRHKISVDAIATSEVSVCMTVEGRYSERLKACAAELGAIADVELRPGRAIICAVGLGLRERPGTGALIFGALREAEINVEMISMGSSKINITLVVTNEDADRALIALHRDLIEAPPQ